MWPNILQVGLEDGFGLMPMEAIRIHWAPLAK